LNTFNNIIEEATMQEFNSATEMKIQQIIRILEPHVITRDGKRIGAGIVECHAKHGTDILKAAWIRLTRQHDYLIGLALAAAPQDQQEEIAAKAYDVIADQLTKAGLRIEDHLRVSEKGVCLTSKAIAVIAATGFPSLAEFRKGLDSLQGVGLNRNPFWHSLADAEITDDDLVNLWAAASMFINAALGWLEGEATEAATKALKDAVTSASPTVCFETLISRARYDDRLLLKLASLAHEGLNNRCDQAFKKQ